MKKLLGLLLVGLLFISGCSELNKTVVPISNTKSTMEVKDTPLKIEKPDGYSVPSEKPEDAGDVKLMLKKDSVDAAFGIWAVELTEAIDLKEHTNKMAQFEFEQMKIGSKEVYRGHTVEEDGIIYLYLFDFEGYRIILSASTVEKDVEAFKAVVEKVIESLHK